MEKKSRMMDIAVIGFALFAMFFGAGNLIFPPFLGLHSADGWLLGFTAYFIADIGLALLAILAMLKCSDISIEGLTQPLGKIPAIMIGTIIVLCIGPGIAIPRTGATAFEIGIAPIFPGLSPWIFGAIFFGIVLFFSLNESNVIDIIGKFMTPVLVIALLAMIVLGIVDPIGDIAPRAEAFNPVREGILSGYQTLDVLAATVFILILVASAREKGYGERKSMLSIILKASIFATVVLLIVYGGLCFLGATTSGGGFEGLNQTALLVAITHSLLGNMGVYLLAVIVVFATLTTAIGLTSSCAAYFDELTHGKLAYKKCVIGIVVFSYVISNFGVSTIVSIAAPVLTVFYPVILVMCLLTLLFKKAGDHRNMYRVAAAVALVISFFEVLSGYVEIGFVQYLPLAGYQCGWLVPAAIGAVIGRLIPVKSGNGGGKDDSDNTKTILATESI